MEIEVVHDGGRVVLRDGGLAPFLAKLEGPEPPPVRLVYAAAHVVMLESYRDLAHSIEDPGPAEAVAQHIDWTATMEFRRRLDGLGFGIAEAMDTAQRFGLGWIGAKRLIQSCGALGLQNGFVAGAGTDHLDAVPDIDTLVEGVVFQTGFICESGGEVILLPMPQLTSWGLDADGYVEVYRRILERIDGPVYLHWLGEMFLPSLAGYFPGDSFLRVMGLDPSKVRGAKLSLLDAELEMSLRAALRENDQIMLTGDDFGFAALIGGDGPATGTTRIGERRVPTGSFSHALLGILDGIAVPASVALRCLARGDRASYLAIMEPCQELSRVIFEAPTGHYKAGLAFLSWLNGHQDNFMLVHHEEAARDRAHYVRVAELAARCGAIEDAARAADRLRQIL